jgi:hypothetical protein
MPAYPTGGPNAWTVGDASLRSFVRPTHEPEAGDASLRSFVRPTHEPEAGDASLRSFVRPTHEPSTHARGDRESPRIDDPAA